MRNLFLSADFRTKHAQVTEMVLAAIAWPGSKWKLIPDIESFRHAFHRAKARGNRAIAVALVRGDADSERGQLPLDAVKLSEAGFLEVLRASKRAHCL